MGHARFPQGIRMPCLSLGLTHMELLLPCGAMRRQECPGLRIRLPQMLRSIGVFLFPQEEILEEDRKK